MVATGWFQVLGFMHRLASMAEGNLHPDILSGNIHDALGDPGYYNSPTVVQTQCASLDRASSGLDGSIVFRVDWMPILTYAT